MTDDFDNPNNQPDPAAPTADASGARQLVLVKHGQRYIFRYEPGEESKVLQKLIQMVQDPECDFDWFDAAVLSHQMGQRISQQIEQMRKP